ncbi:fibroblast growth factor 19 isoform 2-T2 [Spinachia spinachia]
MLLLVVTLSVANMFFAIGVICLPLTDQGLHTDDDWGQSVRVKHLYAARPGLHLLIGEDGRVQGSAQQSPYSLLEITAVDPGCVVIRGVATARFLCIEGDGRLYSSLQRLLSAPVSLRLPRRPPSSGFLHRRKHL